MREVEMLMTDTERKDAAEMLDSVESELPHALDDALQAGDLTGAQKAEAVRRLSDIHDDVSRLPDSENKKRIMKGFESLLGKLAP